MSDRRPGRPVEPNAKRKRFEVRLTDAEAERLDTCAVALGKTRTDTLLYGLFLIEEELKAEEE